jgi:CheY-like chemotaxis protein
MTNFANIIIVDDEPAHAGLVEILLDDIAPSSDIAIVNPSEIDELSESAPCGAQLLIDRHLGNRDALKVVQHLSTDRQDMRTTLMSTFVTESDSRRGPRRRSQPRLRETNGPRWLEQPAPRTHRHRCRPPPRRLIYTTKHPRTYTRRSGL